MSSFHWNFLLVGECSFKILSGRVPCAVDWGRGGGGVGVVASTSELVQNEGKRPPKEVPISPLNYQNSEGRGGGVTESVSTVLGGAQASSNTRQERFRPKNKRGHAQFKH